MPGDEQDPSAPSDAHSLRNPGLEEAGFYDDPTLNVVSHLPVTVGTITAGSCRVEYAVSTHLAAQDGAVNNWIIQSSGPYLDVGRNDVIRRFLPLEDQFLLFVDTDIEYKSADVAAMVQAAFTVHAGTGTWPVIGGLYMGWVHGGAKLVAYDFKATDDDPVRRFYPLEVSTLDDCGDISDPHIAPLLEVGGIGTGFMLIHRSILEAMPDHYDEPQPWFWEGAVDGQWFGEDLIFCLRVQELGHPVYAHSGVRLTHYKEIGLAFPDYPAPAPAPSTPTPEGDITPS